jgi:hypothetical protein
MAMPPAGNADVIVAVDRVTPSAVRSLRRVLEAGDPVLNRLIVVTAHGDDPDLDSLARSSPAFRLVRHTNHPPDTEAWNLGLRERGGDCVLLEAGTLVAPGWLTELSAAAASEERVAVAWPLSNLSFVGSQIENGDNSGAGIDEGLARKAFSGFPQATSAPSVHGPCVYLRCPIIDAIGLLDPRLSTFGAAIEDWVMRAQTVGFFGKRANHAYVEYLPAGVGADDIRFLPAQDRAILEQRHPYRAHQLAAFAQSLDGQLPRHAIDFLRTGKLRIAFDIRHVATGDESARAHAIDLARALGKAPEINLCLLVNDPAQAVGFCAPLITADAWRDDFAVIHKPAPFLARQELAIPYGSSAHVVVTVDEWASRGTPASASDAASHDADGTTRSLGLLCAQGILACSRPCREQIARELGIPPAEIALAPRDAMVEAVIRVYRSVVLNPSERSLQSRRMLRDAILSWSKPAGHPVRIDAAHSVPDGPTVGVRQAWHALNAALQRRLGREMRRLRPPFTSKHV